MISIENLKLIMTTITGILLGFMVYLLSHNIAEYLLTVRALEVRKIPKKYKALRLISNITICTLLSITQRSFTGFLFTGAIVLLLEVQLVTDFRNRIIPNEIILALLCAKLIYLLALFVKSSLIISAIKYTALSSVLGLLSMLLLFTLQLLFGGKIGMGDIKLACAIGICLGLPCSLIAVALCGFLCLIFIVLQPYIDTSARLWSIGQRLKQAIPLGVVLAIAAELVLIANNIHPITFINGVI